MRFVVLLMLIFPLLATAKGKAIKAYPPPDACFQAAAVKYNLDPYLLWSVAQVESGGRTNAINLGHQTRTGSVDLGIMQINSSWLPKLARYGITRDRLMTDRCLNIEVGAWILADSIQRHGMKWNAVGAYNAACSQLKGKDCENARMTYVTKVWRWYSASRPSAASLVQFQQQVPAQTQAANTPSIRFVEESTASAQ